MNITNINHSSIAFWDTFINESINGTFINTLHFETHRSAPCQNLHLVLYEAEVYEATALITGRIIGNEFITSPNSTYGGFIFKKHPNFNTICSVFESLHSYLIIAGVTNVSYSPSPFIYHRNPFHLDVYYIRSNTRFTINNSVSSTLDIVNEKPKFSKRKMRNLRRSKLIESLTFEEGCVNLQSFWRLLTANLKEKHNSSPVHKYLEIKSLFELFPDNISLHVAKVRGDIQAGVILFKTRTTWHCQYIANNQFARSWGLLDCLLERLINMCTVRYFNFGSSNERNGNLNLGLYTYKNEFGAGSILHENLCYQVPQKAITEL